MNIIELKQYIIDFFINFLKTTQTFFNNISDFFILLVDIIFNGPEDKPEKYKLNITLLCCLILIVILILIKYINPYNFLESKYKHLFLLSILSIFVIILYFFVHRRDIDKDNLQELYKLRLYDEKKNLTDETKQNRYFKYKAFNETIKNPILKLFKYVFSLIFILLVPCILLILSIYFITKYDIFDSIKYILGLLLLITTLAVIAKSFDIKTDKNDCNVFDTNDPIITKILCIIKQFIFFIPCLLVILVDEIRKDIYFTPSSVYLLLFLEILIICLFILLPILAKFILTLNKHDLLSGDGPYYLNKKVIIGKYKELNKSNTSNKNYLTSLFDNFILFDINDNPTYNLKIEKYNTNENTIDYKYSYSISFYLYLQAHSKNTNESYSDPSGVEIFNYGNKPKILYNGTTGELVIKSQIQDDTSNDSSNMTEIFRTSDIKYQKWLYFVINYENNIIDIFIDGKLVASKNNVPLYFNNDSVTLGSDNGIYGSIKDIYYFDEPQIPNNVKFLSSMVKD